MAINDALKKLINTLGGTYTADDDTVSELLEQVDAAFAGGGGGSSLPEVTSDDNGDVLTVVEGAWAKATPKNNEFVVTYTVTESEGAMSATCDKEYSDIVSAIEDGKQIVCKFAGVIVGQTSTYATGVENVLFTLAMASIDSFVGVGINHASDGTITVFEQS